MDGYALGFYPGEQGSSPWRPTKNLKGDIMKRFAVIISMALVLVSCANKTDDQTPPTQRPMKTYYPPAASKSTS